MKTEKKLVKDLRKEYADLNGKLHRLRDFIYSKDFAKLSEEDQKLLKEQKSGMVVYLTALLDRIKLHDDAYFTICESCGKIINCYDNMGYDGADCYFCSECMEDEKQSNI